MIIIPVMIATIIEDAITIILAIAAGIAIVLGIVTAIALLYATLKFLWSL